MNFTAQVLVIADEQGAVFQAAGRLEDRGLPTILAESDETALIAANDFNVGVVLIDAIGRDPQAVEELSKALKASIPDRPLPIIAVSDNVDLENSQLLASVLFPPVHPAQLASRVQSVLRLSLMEEEVQLRTLTLEELGIQPDTDSDDQFDELPMSILFTGGAAPQFISLKNSLETAGAEVTAALTSFTSFDYLHDKTFDVIVLNVLKELEPAFTIASAMRRNTRLFHVPAVMLVDPSSFDEVDEAYARGASDLVYSDHGPEVVRQRILNLASDRRRREQIKQQFEAIKSPAVIDSVSGLFTAQFFAKHLTRATDVANKLNRPLSLCVIRAVPPPGIAEAKVEAARKQFGGMLQHLVRAEDMAARIDPGVFAVLMPGGSKQSAQLAAKRIEGVVDCTAFESDDPEKPFQLELEIEVLELQSRETPEHLLDRAIKQ
ncbi:MAG: diguanylate cyclase [Robiginitomaculum sp.]|nr:diguanylate cyclase [Robiginitomaculum sp.]